jgi:hypothetical protein
MRPSPSECIRGLEEAEGHVQYQGTNKDLLPGGLKAQIVRIPAGDELVCYARARGFEIFDKMCLEKERVQMSEAALTAKARMELFHEMADHGHFEEASKFLSEEAARAGLVIGIKQPWPPPMEFGCLNFCMASDNLEMWSLHY